MKKGWLDENMTKHGEWYLLRKWKWYITYTNKCYRQQKLSLYKFVLPFIILYKFSLGNVENCLSAVFIADMIIIYSDYSSIDMISQNINNKYKMQTPP